MPEISGYYLERGFIEGLHGTRDELRYVDDVVINGIIRTAGYRGRIMLIGSRKEGSRISINRYNEFIDAEDPDLPVEKRVNWLQWLNRAATERKVNRVDLPLLVDKLPIKAPEVIARFLEEGDPESDFDLLLRGLKPKGTSMTG